MTDEIEINPAAISELMARDPLKLTKTDRSLIIHYLRENRKRFIAGNKSAGKAPKAVVEKALKPKAPKEKVEISLDELDL